MSSAFRTRPETGTITFSDTYKKANAFANTMCRLFKDSGLHFLLHARLEIAARAAGFASWQVLVRTAAFPPVDETKFYDRFFGEFPFACRPPFNAWPPREAVPETVPGYRLRFYLDAIPYLLATMALHRRTPVLAPGSGAGQKMRARIVGHSC